MVVAAYGTTITSAPSLDLSDISPSLSPVIASEPPVTEKHNKAESKTNIIVLPGLLAMFLYEILLNTDIFTSYFSLLASFLLINMFTNSTASKATQTPITAGRIVVLHIILGIMQILIMT